MEGWERSSRWMRRRGRGCFSEESAFGLLAEVASWSGFWVASSIGCFGRDEGVGVDIVGRVDGGAVDMVVGSLCRFFLITIPAKPSRDTPVGLLTVSIAPCFGTKEAR